MPNYPNEASLLDRISGYKGALSLDPCSRAFVPLSEAYRKLGKVEEAERVALEGTRSLPGFSPGYTALGRVQAQRGALEAALESFEKALAIDPKSILALKGLARVRMLKGEKELASDLLRRVLALEPADAGAKKMLGALKQEAAPVPPVKAVADTRGAGSSHKAGTDPISTATIAEIYVRQGFLERALQVYRDLCEADPENEKFRLKLLELQKQVDAQRQETIVTQESSSQGRLAVLDRWLDSIARRRNRVS